MGLGEVGHTVLIQDSAYFVSLKPRIYPLSYWAREQDYYQELINKIQRKPLHSTIVVVVSLEKYNCRLMM